MYNVSIIGAGNMATTIVSGLVKSGWLPGKILVCSRGEEKRNRMHQEWRVVISNQNIEALTWAQVIIIAVKPSSVEEVLKDFAQDITKDHVIVSLAAGIDIDAMLRYCKVNQPHIIRAMPNTPCSIGKGVTGLYSATTSDAQKKVVEDLFNTLGLVCWVGSEEKLNHITALFGSGPAYVFLFMEILQQIAEELELDPVMAKDLVMQLVSGASELACKSTEDFQELRCAVTSEKGTTAAAIEYMIENKIKTTIGEGVLKAVARAKEIQTSLKGVEE